MTLIFILMLFVGYLIGSINVGILVCKMFQAPDPRHQGSHNPGATNVLRIAGKKLGLLTLGGDIFKGVIVLVIAKHLDFSLAAQAWLGLSVILGHLYPLFFKFQGGKGVATASGVLLILAWPLGLGVLLTWLMVMIFSRYVSLSSIVASLSAPLWAYLCGYHSIMLPISLISMLIVYRHHSNISRLWRKEGKKNLLQ